jgi:ELWxxDGT repeat protein
MQRKKRATQHYEAGHAFHAWCWRLLLPAVYLAVACLVQRAYAEPDSSSAGAASQTNPINPSSNPDSLTVVGETLFFTADDGIHGRELWMSSIEGRCTIAADVWPGPKGSNPRQLMNAQENLYFLADDPEHGAGVWGYDSARGTARRIENSPADESKTTPLGFAENGVGEGWAFLFTENSPGKFNLCAIKAGEFTSRTLAELAFRKDRPLPKGIGFVNGRFLLQDLFSLLESRGSPETTVRISSVSMASTGTRACILDGRGLFVARANNGEGELWVTDGTPDGTKLLRDIRPGLLSSKIAGLFRQGDAVYFQADDGESGLELWRTDGTTEETGLLADINPGQNSSDPHYFCSVGAWLYFIADDGVNGSELWRTDGARERTRMVKDLYPGAQGSGAWSLAGFQERLYFCANNPEYGEEIWTSDGTDEGTYILKDIVAGTGNSGPDNLTAFKQNIFFTCDDGIHGEELWMSDGTPDGTRLAADIALPIMNPSSSPRRLTAVGNTLFFTACDAEHGRELWTSDGTDSGTVLVRDIAEGPTDSDPDQLVVTMHRLFFTAEEPAAGRELWTSDGTDTGTVLVSDIRKGPQGCQPQHIVPYGQGILFTADDGIHGRELWRSDGTSQGTFLVHDFVPGPEGGQVTDLFTFGEEAFMYVGQLDTGVSLWRVSPSDLRVEKVLDEQNMCGDLHKLLAAGPSIMTTAQDAGSRAIVQEMPLLAAIFPPPRAADPASRRITAPVRFGEDTYFVVHTPDRGAELWKTDGTYRGTGIVLDAFPGPASSSPDFLVVVGDTLYFIAEHPELGRVLWRTQGNEKSTRVVLCTSGADAYPPISPVHIIPFRDRLLTLSPRPSRGEAGQLMLGRLSCWPDNNVFSIIDVGKPAVFRVHPEIVTAGERAFFPADDGVHGEELWMVDVSTGTLSLVKDISIAAGSTRETSR